MSATLHPEDGLFDGGPPMKLQRLLRIAVPPERRIARRAALVVAIGWVPLAVLSMIEAVMARDIAVARPFFTDFAAYARFAIAAPLFILAEADSLPRLAKVADHFREAGLVRESEINLYEQAIKSTRRLLDSAGVEVFVWVLTYAITAVLMSWVHVKDLPAWHGAALGSDAQLSMAGFWSTFISLPLLLGLIIGWLWKIIVWGRFLWLMERLDLNLNPSHPDLVGGLKFVATSLRGFRLLAFAFGVMAAGRVANQVFHHSASPLDFKSVVIGVAILVVILAAGPLLVFTRKLRRTRRRGIFAYGMLASAVGREFERKWIAGAKRVDAGALEASDFSATTDLNQIVANVYGMKDIPFGWKNLTNLVIAALFPFVPVALLVVPFKEILNAAIKLLF